MQYGAGLPKGHFRCSYCPAIFKSEAEYLAHSHKVKAE